MEFDSGVLVQLLKPALLSFYNLLQAVLYMGNFYFLKDYVTSSAQYFIHTGGVMEVHYIKRIR